MARIIADRVQETSTTTGTGTYTLAGSVAGFRAASAVCANGDTFTYYAEDVDAFGRPTGSWETGFGTWGTGNTLTRSIIYASSNANAAVNWAAGTRRIAMAIVANEASTFLKNNQATTTIGSGITASPIYLSMSDPGVGYSSGFQFQKANDGAGLYVTENVSDQTLYEFWMSDNPDGGDYFSWRFTDWQGTNGLWQPLQYGGLTGQYVAQNHYFYGTISQPNTGRFYTTSNIGGTGTFANQQSFNTPSKLKVSGSGTNTITTLDVSGYTGTSAAVFTIKLTGTGTTFDWGYGSSGFTAVQTGLSVSTSPVSLSNGIAVTFASTSTGAAGDLFQCRVYREAANSLGATTVSSLTTPGVITSTIATGTAPLTITSTTVVTNLNADLLDGQHGSYYAPIAAPSFTTSATAPYFVSSVATGTAPLTVTSTTAVTNLNADMLDGQHGSYYAAGTHKYHAFSNGQYFFDDFSQSNFFQLFTMNSVYDTTRFCPIQDVEYHNGTSWVAWSGGDAFVQILLDGRENTTAAIDHTHRKFRFTVTKNTGWPLMALIMLQSTWTAITYTSITLTIESSTVVSGGTWTVKDTCVFNSTNTANQWGTHVKASNLMHNGELYNRITIDITDWTDSSSYVTAPLVRFAILSNYVGGAPEPWTWDYTKAVTFSAPPKATQFNSTVATGTAPLIVASSTQVNNLNANYLQGLTAASFATSTSVTDTAIAMAIALG